jgi:hypothetical protein
MVPSPWRWCFLKLPKYIALLALVTAILQSKLAVALEAALRDGAVELRAVREAILACAVRLAASKLSGVAGARQEVFDDALTLDDALEKFSHVYIVGRSEGSVAVRHVSPDIAGIEAAFVAQVLHESWPLVFSG